LTLSEILSRRPTSLDGVVKQMSDIDALLPDDDGVKWFNRLYLRVTTAVGSEIAAGPAFADPRFLHELDTVFANQYFDALHAGLREPSSAPAAWRPLLEARRETGIARLQFALAGMNAHINRDLPEGICRCCASLGGDGPSRGSDRYDDFQRINGILEAVEEQVKGEFLIGVLGKVDAAAGPLDDHLAMWKVRAAREAAWTHAQVLWSLRRTPRLSEAFFESLDRFTGFAGRGLLAHVL
jgi:hypothetical protein